MPISSLAMLSVHTCPLATLGGKKTGGMNVYIKELTRALGDHGVSVNIFTRCEDVHADTIKQLGSKGQVIHIPSGPPKTLDPLSIYPHLHEFVNNVLRHQQNSNKTYRLLHSHYWLSGLVALKLRSRWHLPVLQTFHTLQRVKEVYFPATPANPVRLKAEIRLVEQADHFLVSTEDEKTHLANLYQADPQKITIIPPGVDTQKFRPLPQDLARRHLRLPPDVHLLLFVGRIEPFKGLHILLKALHLIQPRANLCIAVIGGGDDPATDPELNRIKQLAAHLHLQNLTIFLGSKDQDTLPYYYSAADLTIVPSSYESFGLVALESMACGTPVIASEVGGLKHLIKPWQTGLTIPPHVPNLLAQAIQDLLTHPDKRRQLGHQAHLEARNYSWEKIVPRFINLYQHIAQT